MKAGMMLGLGALTIAVTLGGAAQAQSQNPQTRTHNPEAAPAEVPASQATVNAVTGPNLKVNPKDVGNHEAAPTEKPAKQETVEAVKVKP